MTTNLRRISASTLILSLSALTLLSPKAVGQNPLPPTGPPSVDQSVEERERMRPTREPQRAPSQKENEDDIVRITTNLVQIDAVVTDKNGNQVTDLTADDFEILEDGKPQKITNFSFVNNENYDRPTATNALVSKSTTPPAARAAERPRRTIAIVIDDLLMAFESANQAKRAIRKFIDEKMQPGDQVAVVRTSAGVGALQQFTSNKRQLYAAIEHVRSGNHTVLDLLQRCKVDSFTPTLDPQTNAPSEKQAANEFDGFREESLFTGTLGAINFIVRGLRELPGRKALVVISDGLLVCPDDQARLGPRMHERLRKIADLANRASVVVYSIDPRGLITLDDASQGGSSNVATSAGRLRTTSAAIFNSQGSFDPIVYSTGGFPVYNNNDIGNALQRVVDDQKGYYLIGYRPGDETFDSKKGAPRFNDLKIRLKRPGLSVRTRSGFYGVADLKTRPVRRTRQEQLMGSLAAPFSSGDIDVRLTSLFGNEVSGSFILSMLHINPAGLTFTPQSDGWQQAVMDVLAVTFDADGQIVEQVNKTQTIRARGNAFQRLMKSGLVYSLSVPVKKAGGYQLRIAVRDAASERVGSASQFIEVPGIEKNRLSLSGIAVHESKLPAVSGSPAEPVPVTSSASEPTTYEPQAGPALRRFHQESVLDYDYSIYNATFAAAPQVKTQVTVSRDDQDVLVGAEKTLDVAGQADLKRIRAGGRLLLGKSLPPGEYVLKITVVDLLAKTQYATATQWIDFEILP